MEHMTDASRGNTEILNFLTSRILFFKRIDHTLLLEVLHEKFPGQNAENFLNTLIEDRIVKIDNEHVVILKESQLAGLLSIREQSCQATG